MLFTKQDIQFFSNSFGKCKQLSKVQHSDYQSGVSIPSTAMTQPFPSIPHPSLNLGDITAKKIFGIRRS